MADRLLPKESEPYRRSAMGEWRHQNDTRMRFERGNPQHYHGGTDEEAGPLSAWRKCLECGRSYRGDESLAKHVAQKHSTDGAGNG